MDSVLCDLLDVAKSVYITAKSIAIRLHVPKDKRLDDLIRMSNNYHISAYDDDSSSLAKR